MTALILTFLILIPYFSYDDDNVLSKYFTFSVSLSFAYAFLGLVGMILVFTKITYLPLTLILFFILFSLLFRPFFRTQLFNFFRLFFYEINTTKKQLIYKKTYIFFYFIIFTLLISSIGPINHSDTANIYVGYPYQFLKNNSHFIDGNLNQGLLGIGDFANIFYFKDNTSWLIRSSQFIPLFFVFLLILKRKIPNIIILIFLTSPVFLQWLTIGKNNFLIETCLSIAFLVWEEKKDKKYLVNILSLIFIAISFKVSSILICLPIIFYISYYYRDEISKFKIGYIFNLLKAPLIISLLSLISILSYRNFLINNPTYPLLSTFFNSGNQQLIDWENTLRGWDRNGLFPLWLFIPKSFGKISFVLGPANFLLFSIIIFSFFKRLFVNNVKLVISILQFSLLILFAQGRADYYMSPLIFLIFGFNKDLLFNIRNFIIFDKSFLTKNFLIITIIIQCLMFFISSLYSIMLLGFVLKDYEMGMNKTAYNFYNSKKIERIASGPVMNKISGTTNLYFNGNYISNHKFNKCFYYDKTISQDQKYNECVNQLGIKTIIVKKDELKNNPNFLCKSEFLKIVSRNIFLEKRVDVDFCIRNN